ncbi:MAG: DUF5995 family protein [Acidimicrobiia bacterium]
MTPWELYLSALRELQQGDRTTRCWEICFAAGAERRPIILQHLILGINAHINLDLGVAAAEVAPAGALPGLRRDFDRINEILALLVGQVQRDIGALSPWIALLDRVSGHHDERMIKFSMEVARTDAWRFGVELAPLDRRDWGGPIGARDASIARLGRVLLNPGFPLSAKLRLIGARESGDVRRNIEVLNRVAGPDLRTVDARVKQERALGE